MSAARSVRAPAWGRGPDDDELPIGDPDDGDWEDVDDDEEEDDDDEEPLQVRGSAAARLRI